MATRSRDPSEATRVLSPDFRRGSLSSAAIEPETSTRKTRLLADALPRSVAEPSAFMPTLTSLCPGLQGQSPTSVVTAIGSAPRGAG